MTTEADLLAARWREWGLEDTDVAETLRTLTDTIPTDVSFVAGGWSSVAFGASLGDDAVVVRMKPVQAVDCGYAREAATVAHVRAHGIPGPDPVARGRWRDFDACIAHRVPGRSLQSLALDRGPDDPVVRRGARDAGRVLRAVHEIPLPDHLEPARVRPAAKLRHHLRGYGDDAEQATLDEAAARIEATLGGERPRALVHGDFGPDHVFVDPDTGVVTGLLDWELAAISDPAKDLGWWDAYFGEHHGPTPGVAAVRRGYGIVTDPRFDDRVGAWALYEALAGASHDAVYGLETERAGLTARLGQLVAQHRAPARGNDHTAPDR